MFGQVRVLWPGPSGICDAWVSPGAVEQWLSRSRAAAVIGEAARCSLRWPAGSPDTRPAHRHPPTGFSTAPLRVPRRFSQASVRPSSPPRRLSAPLAARTLHSDGYRGDAAGKPTDTHYPLKASSPDCPMSIVMPSSRRNGRHIRSGSSSFTTVKPRWSAGTGFSSSSGRSALMTTSAGTVLTASTALMHPANSLTLGGMSRDQQARDRRSHSSIPLGRRTRARRAAGGRPRPRPRLPHMNADERARRSARPPRNPIASGRHRMSD